MLFNLNKLLYQLYQLNKIYFLRYILRFIFFILCTTHIINLAHAEKSDANKPTIIDSERVTINEATQTKIFEGNVIINKGTLLIKADRIEATVDASGYQILKAQGRKEQPTRFQQKRDGLDEIIEAQSVRLVFDGKADTITLFDQAIIRRVSKNVLQDEVRGATIKYFNQTNSYEVSGGSSSSQANGRVRTIIAPRTVGQ